MMARKQTPGARLALDCQRRIVGVGLSALDCRHQIVSIRLLAVQLMISFELADIVSILSILLDGSWPKREREPQAIDIRTSRLFGLAA